MEMQLGDFFGLTTSLSENKHAGENQGSGTDSPWSIIIGWAKNIGATPEEILYDYSYANLSLYSAATPQFDDEQPPKWDAKLDANNPENFTDDEDEEEVFVKEY